MRYISWFIFFISSFSFGQSLLPDSLSKKPIEEKITFLNSQGQKTTSIDSSTVYFDELFLLLNDCDCDSLKTDVLYDQARYFTIKGQVDLGLKKLHLLNKHLKNLDDPVYSYRMESLYSYAYFLKDEDSLNIKHLENALDHAKQMNDSVRIADTYNNLGKSFLTVNIPKAKNYLESALKIYNRQNNPKYIHNIYQNLSKTVPEKDSITYFTQMAYRHIPDTTDVVTMTLFYLDKAEAYFDSNFYPESKEPALKAYQYAKKIEYDYVIQVASSILGKITFEEGNYAQSINYLEEAVKIEDASIDNKKETLFYLSTAYQKTNQLKKAVQTDNILFQLYDSIISLEKDKTFAEFDAKFRTEQKDKEIAQQQLEIAKQKNTRNQWVFGSIAALLLALGAFQWFSSKQKRKKVAIEAELQKEQEINELRSKFLGNIAHEIRTPLTLITGNLDLALENFEKSNQAKKNIEVALENSKRVTQDANEILELLKFEKSKVTVNKETVEVDKVLKRIVFAFKSLADIKQIEITYTSNLKAEESYNIDIEKTEKIINNLMSNAIKHSPSNSVIQVNSSIENNMLTVEVIDQGTGISFNEQDKIFERFYQSKSSEAIGGIGIGLSLSRELANLMSGTLHVKSEPNKGSTFILSLPVEKVYIENKKAINQEIDSVASKPEEKEQGINENSFNNASILIVEDNPQMASYLKELLENDFKCTVAFDGEEALNKLETESFDLITSDIMMPKLNGFQLREKINESETLKSIPFILISAKTLEEDKVKGFMLGIDDYIVKPFNKNELLARVKNLLSNKREREQWKIDNSDLLSDTTSADEKLLKKLESTVLENLSNEDFSVKDLAESANYSQRQLTRIIKQYTGMTPVKFVLEIRLQKAYQLLKHKSYFTLSEVRYDVGITSSPYFNKKFKERYGIIPSEMLT